MQISDESLKEFMDICEHELGERLSVDEAREAASSLLELYALLCSPTPRERAELAKQAHASTVAP